MRRNGFSIVELVVVMAMMGILLSIATFSWNAMNTKSAIETEAKTLYTDLMAVRLDALYTKQGRSVVVIGNQFKVYNSNDTSAAPASTKTLRYPLKWTPSGTTLTIAFDASGLVPSDIPVCVDQTGDLSVTNTASVDSLVISQARMKLGKRNDGGACDVPSITYK